LCSEGFDDDHSGPDPVTERIGSMPASISSAIA